MAQLLYGLVLIIVGLAIFALQRFYSCVPVRELKRLAAQGDHLAQALYRPVSYGESMRLLLWLLCGVSLAAGFITISAILVGWAAFIIIGISLAAVVVLQSLRLTVRSARLVAKVTPVLGWILDHMHLPFDLVARAINRFRTHIPHSGLYETDDLIALLHQQKDQIDNRINTAQLDTMIHALQVDAHQAADLAEPMSRLKLVHIDDHIGPVLLGELHASKQTSFLVYQDTKDKVVGTLFLHDAVQAREGGRVADLMRPRLCFVHEDFSLRQVLHAFVRTGQIMLVVINAFEEAVGVITLQRLLTELIGETTGAEDFTAYDDRGAVAAFRLLPQQPALEQVTDDEPEPEPAPSPEETEVVE